MLFNQDEIIIDILLKTISEKIQRQRMELPHDMTSLSEVMNNQKKKGFTEDFEYKDNKFFVKEKNKEYEPEELTIVQVFRFEGISDPAYMEVLYSVEADDGTKGTFVDAFGAYGAQDAQGFASSLKRMRMVENHSKD